MVFVEYCDTFRDHAENVLVEVVESQCFLIGGDHLLCLTLGVGLNLFLVEDDDSADETAVENTLPLPIRDELESDNKIYR